MNRSYSKWLWPGFLVAGVLVLSGATLLVKARSASVKAPTYHWTVGQNLTYAVNYSNIASADFQMLLPDDKGKTAPSLAPSNLVQTVESGVTGKWVMSVVSQNDKGVVVACHLEKGDVTLSSSGQDATQQADTIRHDLETPCFARVSPQGKILDVRFDGSTQSISQNFARALLAESQFVVAGAAKNATSWDSNEEDTLGQYVAHYQIAPENTKSPDLKAEGVGTVFRKTKIRYLPVGKATVHEAQMAQTIAPDTNIVAHFDGSNGSLSSLHGLEKQTVSLGGQGVAHAQTTVDFKLESQTSLDAKDLEELQGDNAKSEKAADPIALFVPPSADEVRQASRERTLGDETLGTLLTELAAHQKAGETDSSELYLKFRALADLHPESCPFLGKLLAIAPTSSLTFWVMNQSLASVESSQAQDALLFAIQARPNDQDAVLRLIPAVAIEKNPSGHTQKVLMQLSSSPLPAVASTAQLALGGMAHSLAQSAPARSKQIVDTILDQASYAKSPAQIQQLLLTLGNTGSPRALPILQRYTQSENIVLRGIAVNSLRFIASPDAGHTLEATLTQDTHPEVRLQAARALSFRAQTDASYQAQKAVLQSDRSADVRLALLNNLSTEHKNLPELKGVIQNLAAHDESPDVRKAAALIKKQSPEIFGS